MLSVMQNQLLSNFIKKHLRTDIPVFRPGDTLKVHVKIKEGEKERIQIFEGLVISLTRGLQGAFVVRKMSFGTGVERIFPFASKSVEKVEKIRSFKVRRAKLYYIRGLRGKAARLREVDTRVKAAKLALAQAKA